MSGVAAAGGGRTGSGPAGAGRAGIKRVGHKGAEAIVPGNTVESFAAALAAGVDMIEFDVLRAPDDGRLLLAHDYDDITARDPLALEAALAVLSDERFSAIELNVDLKLPGYEDRVLDALGAAGLLERALISSQYPSSLAAIRAAQAGVRLGWSVPRVRRDPFRSRAMRLPAHGIVLLARWLLPDRAARVIEAGYCEAIMAHWRLATPALVRAVHRAGGELYVWTVDELPMIRRLEALGVAGIISNDPRLFAVLGGPQTRPGGDLTG